MMVVERDIGRLAKYTFDMGGTGDLLSLSLNVPPWDDLHEFSPQELQLTGLVTTDAVADVLPEGRVIDPAKSVQDHIVSSSSEEKILPTPKSTKTAGAASPTGGVTAVALPLK
jgi:hypothetical protein